MKVYKFQTFFTHWTSEQDDISKNVTTNNVISQEFPAIFEMVAREEKTSALAEIVEKCVTMAEINFYEK